MIKIFNSGYNAGNARFIELDEVNIVTQNIDYNGCPYIMFEHKDYPLGALMARFDGTYWACDMD